MGFDLDAIIDFCCDGNPLWKERYGLDKQKVRNFLKQPHVYIQPIYQNDILSCVGIYLRTRTHVHFISLTSKGRPRAIREGIKAVIAKHNPKMVSWLTPKYRLITKEV